jgi:hypothetical protein
MLGLIKVGIAMKPLWKFRLFALLVFVLVEGLSISSLVAEFLRPVTSPLRSRIIAAPTPDQVEATGRASAVAPYRSDLKADYAVALAGRALKSEYAPGGQANDAAQNAVRDALKIGPHDSRMWLVLALLQAQSNPGDSLIAESLKMSYLTGPNRAELIPTRLDAVTSHQSLNDTDLKELARGDVRIILTQLPDERQALVNDYLRGSSVGKAFLEESTRTFDPKFADSLRNAK